MASKGSRSSSRTLTKRDVYSYRYGWLEFPETQPGSGLPLRTESPTIKAPKETGSSGQTKKMWVADSGTPQRGQTQSPGPCRLTTSIPNGRRSHRRWHTKILIFNGRDAFHKGVVHARVGTRHRARYAELTENSPDWAK